MIAELQARRLSCLVKSTRKYPKRVTTVGTIFKASRSSYLDANVVFETTNQPTQGFKAVPCIVSLKLKLGIKADRLPCTFSEQISLFSLQLVLNLMYSHQNNIFVKEQLAKH